MHRLPPRLLFANLARIVGQTDPYKRKSSVTNLARLDTASSLICALIQNRFTLHKAVIKQILGHTYRHNELLYTLISQLVVLLTSIFDVHSDYGLGQQILVKEMYYAGIGYISWLKTGLLKRTLYHCLVELIVLSIFAYTKPRRQTSPPARVLFRQFLKRFTMLLSCGIMQSITAFIFDTYIIGHRIVSFVHSAVQLPLLWWRVIARGVGSHWPPQR